MATVKGGNTAGPSNVAVDVVASEDVQRVKLTFGDSTTATRVDTGTPLPVVQTGALPAGSNAIGTVTVQDGGGSITVDGTVGVSGSVPVTDNAGSLTVDAPVGTPVFVRLSDGSSAISTLPVSLPTSGSATVTSQNDQATNATLLAANSGRDGFAIFNESTSFLYIKFGATATASDYTVRIAPGGYFEHMGAGIYTGRVDGIWSADASGAARVTEW